jgi:hypothetical protein
VSKEFYHWLAVGHNEVQLLAYENLRVCARGFSEGKSGVENLQRPLVKLKIEQLFLYIVLLSLFLFSYCSNSLSIFSITSSTFFLVSGSRLLHK